MFTRNYYSLLAQNRLVDSGTYAPITFTNTSGVTFVGWYTAVSGSADAWHNATLVAASDTEKGFFFGNGTTPPSLNDYRCSGEEVTGLSVVDIQSTVTYGENTFRCKVAMILRNNSDREVTISEICKKGRVNYSSANYYGIVVERVVLDTPVVIPAGGSGTVEYITTVQIPD